MWHKGQRSNVKGQRSQKGFTLFEMIVSLGVFSTAMLILLSSLLSITSAQKKAVAMSTAEDNLRFAIDSISKDIRMGTMYNCGGDAPGAGNCDSGGTQLAFKRANNDTVIYKWNLIDQSIVTGSTLSALLSMTDSKVKITRLKFYVIGALAGDKIQPQVTIVLQAEMGSGKVKSVFNVQTTVVQRQIDS